MSVVGHIFSGIGDLLGGSKTAPTPPTPVAPQAPAPQQQAGSKPNDTKSMDPTFLAAAALPNVASGGATGKTLLGQ